MSRFEALDPIAYELPPDFAAGLLSPALVVHVDRVRENLRRVLRYLDGDPRRWRPHVKTTKIPEVWAELPRAGIRQFKCATTREAEVLLETLLEEGLEDPDLLLAYPLIGPALRRLGQIARAFPDARVSVLCEDPAVAAMIPPEVSIFVDVNPGMNRTGVSLEEPGAVLAVARAAGARFRGVHYYDGHLYEGGPDVRRTQVHACYDRLMEVLARLADADVAVGEVITSGTPTFLAALRYPGFRELGDTRHRVSPGTVLYHDARSEEENEDLDLLPAAVVFSRVVSHPTPGIVTCDAGSKAIAAEAGDPVAFVLGRPELVARTPNEEHLPLAVRSGKRPARGTALMLVPRHVCPTVNLAEEAVLVESGLVRAVVPVRARAHEIRLEA